MGKRIKLGLIFSYNEDWIGGSYYILNLIAALNKMPDKKQPLIYILSNSIKDFNSAKDLGYKYLKFYNPYVFEMNLLDRVVDKILQPILGKKIYQKLIIYTKINVLFPATNNDCYDLIKNKIYWFPDFQHLYYPEYFSEIDLIKRNSILSKIASSNKKLVLSSNTSRLDWESMNLFTKCQVFVLPFSVSHPTMLSDNVDEILKEYSISMPYFIVCNQFWKHKNHLIVLKAILACKNTGYNLLVVFTGKYVSNDNTDTFNSFIKFIDLNNLHDNVKILGLIDRDKQLSLMKSSIAVVQPSLFEGWSTVIEDAKALRKQVIASDIPVNREQISENVVFFNPSNEFELANSLKLSSEMDFKEVECDYESKILNFGTNFLELIQN